MESNDQLINTDKVNNHVQQSTLEEKTKSLEKRVETHPEQFTIKTVPTFMQKEVEYHPEKAIIETITKSVEKEAHHPEKSIVETLAKSVQKEVEHHPEKAIIETVTKSVEKEVEYHPEKAIIETVTKSVEKEEGHPEKSLVETLAKSVQKEVEYHPEKAIIETITKSVEKEAHHPEKSIVETLAKSVQKEVEHHPEKAIIETVTKSVEKEVEYHPEKAIIETVTKSVEKEEGHPEKSLVETLAKSVQKEVEYHPEKAIIETVTKSVEKEEGHPEKSLVETVAKSVQKKNVNHPQQSKIKAVTKYLQEILDQHLKKSASETVTNSNKWVVGYWNENSYSVIPRNWLLNYNDSWYSKWPNSSNKSIIEARIIKATDPDKMWKYYPVQVIERYDYYQKAEKETFSCTNVVDQDSLDRGKRKKKSNFQHYDLSEDSDSESSVSVKNNDGSNNQKRQRKSLNYTTVAASTSKQIESYQTSCSDPCSSTSIRLNSDFSNWSTIIQNTNSKIDYDDIDNSFESMYHAMNRIDDTLNTIGKLFIKYQVDTKEEETLEKSRQKKALEKEKEKSLIKSKQAPLTSEKQESLTKAKQEPLTKANREPLTKTKQEPFSKENQEPFTKAKQEPLVKVTEEPLVKVTEEPLVKIKQEPLVKIKQEPLSDDDDITFEEGETLELNATSLVPIDSEFVSYFPMTEIDDIVNFELRLLNSPENEQMFVTYLNSIGGINIKNYVKQILSHTFTDKLSTQCTWRGYHGNVELQRLNLIKIMCGVSKNMFGNSIETAFEVHVKEWFRRSKQRYNRQLNAVIFKSSS